MKRITTWAVLLTVLTTPMAYGQWLVEDALNLVQNTFSAVADVEAAANTAQSVLNEYEMIKHQVEQITYAVQNLQRLDLNYVNEIFAAGRSIVNTLRRAKGVSFDLNRSMTEFDRLYVQLGSTATSGQLFQQQLQWATTRRQAAATAVQVQSVTSVLTEQYGQLCDILNRGVAVQGNLDAQQLQIQQQGLSQGILLQQMQIQAGNARGQALAEAEQAAAREAAIQAMQQATPELPTYTENRGRFANYRW
jgi:P-type conjugative transfer protein TrbJ